MNSPRPKSPLSVTEPTDSARAYQSTMALLHGFEAALWSMAPTRDRLLYLSLSTSSLYGESTENLVLHPNFWLEAIHPDDKPRVFTLMERLPFAGTAHCRYRLLLGDGEVVPVQQRCYLVNNAAGEAERVDFMVFRTEPADAAETPDWQTLFRQLVDPYFLCETEYLSIVTANPASCALTGYRTADLRRLRLTDLGTHGQAHTLAVPGRLNPEKQQAFVCEWLIQPQDNPPKTVECRFSPVSLAGRHWWLVRMRDIDLERRQEVQQNDAENFLNLTESWLLQFDATGSIFFANPSAITRLGLDPQAPLNIVERMPLWAGRLFLHTCLPHATSLGRWSGELQFMDKDSRDCPVEIELIRHGNEEPTRYSLYARERGQAYQREQRLKKENERLTGQNHLRGQMLNNLGRELESPLNELTRHVGTQGTPELNRAIMRLRHLAESLQGFSDNQPF